MNLQDMKIEIHNQKELLRIYENDEKKAKDSKQKSKWESSIANAKSEISKLEAAEKSM